MKKDASESSGSPPTQAELLARVQRREEEMRAEQAPLLEDLRRVGIDVPDVFDLVNSSAHYPSAIPVLVEHLGRDYRERIREGIARALAIREARDAAWDVMLRMFRESDDPTGYRFKGSLGAALSAQATLADFDEVVQLITDRRHGESRAYFVATLLRLRRDDAIPILEDLLDDPQISPEVNVMLRRAKNRKRGGRRAGS